MTPVHTIDLAIRGGTIVAGAGRYGADIGIADGQIVEVGQRVRARDEIDATGKLVLPGGIDMHVHFTPSGHPGARTERLEGFDAGSRSAIGGGITTVGNMTYATPGELMSEALARVAASAAEVSLVDFVLHPVLLDPTEEMLDDIDRLADLGCRSLKIFMVTEAFDRNIEAFINAIDLAGRRGLLTLVHCEDYGIVRYATGALSPAQQRSAHDYARARPPQSERVAVQRAIAISETTAAPLYVVHVSTAAALGALAEAKQRGIPIFVETRPIYAFFSNAIFDTDRGSLYVGNPPLGTPDDINAIWNGIQTGLIDTYCSDHLPWPYDTKIRGGTAPEHACPGTADLETLMPLLFSEGVLRGRLTVEQFVALTAERPARIFGLYPRKGIIRPGSDADLVVWDPALSRIVAPSGLSGKADHTLYDGWRITGWPEITIARGQIAFERTAIQSGSERGRWLH